MFSAKDRLRLTESTSYCQLWMTEKEKPSLDKRFPVNIPPVLICLCTAVVDPCNLAAPQQRRYALHNTISVSPLTLMTRWSVLRPGCSPYSSLELVPWYRSCPVLCTVVNHRYRAPPPWPGASFRIIHIFDNAPLSYGISHYGAH